jgi:hypothetical protein
MRSSSSTKFKVVSAIVRELQQITNKLSKQNKIITVLFEKIFQSCTMPQNLAVAHFNNQNTF